MTNKNLMESTVTRNMGYSGADGISSTSVPVRQITDAEILNAFNLNIKVDEIISATCKSPSYLSFNRTKNWVFCVNNFIQKYGDKISATDLALLNDKLNFWTNWLTSRKKGSKAPVSSVSRKVIQEPVAGVGTAINSTTAPETTDPREELLTENTITPKEESTISEIPVTEDSRTQETTVMTKRPMEVKKGITEGQKNLLIFAVAVFGAAAIVYVVKNYSVKG